MRSHAEDDDNYSKKLMSRADKVSLELAEWMPLAGASSKIMVSTQPLLTSRLGTGAARFFLQLQQVSY